ncbi:heptaprenylglyceryl phosphate synthase [Caldalkalibacillus salinus]|uniref:heptaprenylglyceryl phosphate synthase n=1 Tax=Caldalkalibacillus salinus TaxID=2803787 RepID=UPI0019239232|nr:heptaprenylglyceryl phosphate synthase [Caldalkalibacillus salinus]
MMDEHKWSHAFKLDPDKYISDEDLERICESGSDGIIVGGSSGVTFDNTIDLLGRIRRYAIPCVLEVSNREAIVPGFDHYYIPFVLNAQNPEWIIEPHVQAVKELGTIIPWQDVSLVGYCVLNPKATVARMTDSRTSLDAEDVIAYGRFAQHLLHCSYFYIEYSGTFGDMDLVRHAYQSFKKDGDMHILYGGGIKYPDQVQQAVTVSDTVVVGNIIYEDIRAAIQTVKEVKTT